MMSNILPWHQQAWTRLQEQIREDRLPHAILLQGLAGSGRKHFTDALCAHLICESAQQKPCGSCSQCLLYRSGNYPDLLVVEPAEDSRYIKIDQIRQALEFTRQTANQLGAIKLLVLRPAEAINLAAANSLLKTLEEPPGKILIVLVAEPGKTLLPTIRSRCQVVALNSASETQAIDWMRQNSSASVEDLRAALTLTPGCPMAALALVEQGVMTWRAELQTHLQTLAAGGMTTTALAKIASTQPALRAIHFMEECSANDSRRFAQSGRMQDLRSELEFQKKLVPLKTQLGGSANPNELMALEYVFAEYVALLNQRASS